jgi:hypothetical protein
VRVVAAGQLLDEAIGISAHQPAAPWTVNKLAQHSALGEVLAAGLRAMNNEPRCSPRRDAAPGLGEAAGRAVTHRLERYLNALGTIASAAPLLGLLGTVIGMIEIFGSQAPTRRAATRRAGARHFGGAVQHGVRPDRGHPGADVLPLLPRPGRRYTLLSMELAAERWCRT